jgi:Asp-tRNA(Asn)/Glu-tRNA(Gln) amidotransferase A subunit family amidase
MNVEESLERIARDETNAVPVVFPDEARQMLTDAPDGPLHGVPITIKDMYALPWRGMFNGTRHELLPPQASGMFRRLRDAGAVIVGVANQHELGMGATGAFSAYGACRNPVSLEHCAGGSSSGSAASVAAGLVDMSIGSDSGGSTRIPASFCGVLGLKLTYRSVPTDGYLGRGTTFSAPGTFARTPADLRVLTAAVLDRALPAGAGGALRVGVVSDPFWRDLEPTIEARCRAALAAFADVREIAIDGAGIAGTASTALMMSEMGAGLPSEVLAGLHPFTRALAALPHLLPASAIGRANRVRALVRRAAAAAFADVDVLAWPTSATPVPRLDQAIGGDTGALRQAGFANLTGVPGISVPVGVDDGGLPVGLQVLAPWGEEARLCDIADVLGARLPA